MVLSVTNDEDDPRNVYKAKKMHAFVNKNLPHKGGQTGVITIDPAGELQSSRTDAAASSSYRSHTGHGRSVQSTPKPRRRSLGSKSSQPIVGPPSYHYATDARDDRSNIVTTSRRASVSAREQSAPIANEKASVSERISAYKKNAKIVSKPKVSTYSAAVNCDRYVQSPFAPAATLTPSAVPVIPSKMQNESSPRKGLKPIAKKASIKSRNNSRNKSRNKSVTKSAKPEPLKEEETFDETWVADNVESQDYWSAVKKKEQARLVEESLLGAACGGWNDDDSTVESQQETQSKNSSEGSWNLFDSHFVGEKEELGLVSREELLCDFEASGIDKMQEIHQCLKELTTDNELADLVGRDIVATDMTSEPNEEETAKKMGLMARFVDALAAIVAEEEKESSEKNTDGERSLTVHTVKYKPHRRAKRRSKTATAAAQYLAAVAASNSSSVASSQRSANIRKKVNDDCSPPRESNTTNAGGVMDGSPESENSIDPAMIKAGSAASVKSVRFSEKVETHEPEEVKTPDVPSLMDDQAEEDEAPADTAFVPVVVEEEEKEALKKKLGFFKKLLRRAKQMKKNKRNSESFQPTLEPMNEEIRQGEDETVTGTTGAEAPSKASRAVDTNPSEEPSTAEVPRAPGAPSEGFELIAGCTQTGKKAIMIAKAKNERKGRSEDSTAPLDPPPSTATPVVASNVQERTINVDDGETEGESNNEKKSSLAREEKVQWEDEDDVDDADTFVSDPEDSKVATALLYMFDSLFSTVVGPEDEVETDPTNNGSIEN
ncbi:MAG: hypothetical protein SGBAC_005197 [Bacillariaceae sp.]